jgi:hypothetical protein
LDTGSKIIHLTLSSDFFVWCHFKFGLDYRFQVLAFWSSPPRTCLLRGPSLRHGKVGPRTWSNCADLKTTHVKFSHLVTSLPTSRQQDVFALLVTSCQQVWNNLLTTCNNLVEVIRLVARLFWQVRYMLDITKLLQPCVDNLVTSLLYHGCNKLVSTVL